MRVPEFGWTTQKVFHLMNFAVNASKAACNLLKLYSIYFLWHHLRLVKIILLSDSKGCPIWTLQECVSYQTKSKLSSTLAYIAHAILSDACSGEWFLELIIWIIIYVQFTQFINTGFGKFKLLDSLLSWTGCIEFDWWENWEDIMSCKQCNTNLFKTINKSE